MNHKVLIVEDNQINIQIYKHMFKKEAYTIDFAIDGEQAISKLETQEYSAFILDLNLPGIDGFAVAKYIRDLEHETKTPRKPVIMASASFNAYTNFTTLNKDIDKYFEKPFNIELFKATVALYTRENVANIGKGVQN